MSVSAMGIFRFFVFLFFVVLNSLSYSSYIDNDGILSTGNRHSCVLDDSGVVCWGHNERGQTTVPTLINPTHVAAGGYHSCALDDSGVVCWGHNAFGQTTVPTLSNPTQLSLGSEHSCALDDTGVVCWGSNISGQTTVPALSNPTQLSAGGYHNCVLDDSGVVCWGANGSGRTAVPTLSNPTHVAAGGYHSCALDDSGVVCWGDNESGKTTVPSLSNPTQVSPGGYFSCALDDSGVVCWGENGDDQTIVPELTLNNYLAGITSMLPNVIGDQSDSIMTWDFDEDGNADALTDGLLLLRYAFGLTGDALVSSAIAEASPLTPEQVQDNVHASTTSFADIDDSGNVDALTDGLLLLRYLFGLTGDALLSSAVAENASRSSATDIQAYIDNYIPGQTSADSDDDGVADSLDAFPLNSSESIDTDLDGIGNNADTDDDNDGVADSNDLFPLDASEWSDTDGDGVGDNADAFPNDDLETTDSDGDGVGDNADDLNNDLLNFTLTGGSAVVINNVVSRNSTYSMRLTNNTGKDLILNSVEFFEGDGSLSASANGVDLVVNGIHPYGQFLDITYTAGIFGALLPLTVSYSYEYQGDNFVKTFILDGVSGG